MRYLCLLSVVLLTQSATAGVVPKEPSECLCINWTKEELFKGSSKVAYKKTYRRPTVAKRIKKSTSCPAANPAKLTSSPVLNGRMQTGDKKVTTVTQTCRVFSPSVTKAMKASYLAKRSLKK